MNKKAFYPLDDDEFRLPCTWEEILSLSSEELDDDTKLMHLFYAVNSGFPLKQEIQAYLKEHHQVSEAEVTRTLVTLIARLRYGQSRRSEDDRSSTCIVLTDNLTLDEIIDLLAAELQMRFSVEERDGGELIFSQRYLRALSVEKMLNGKGADEIRDIIIHPTGYKPMTDAEIIKANRWREITGQYGRDALYSEDRQHVYPEDVAAIHAFNATASEPYRYVLGVPAEPWQGNPLTAKLVILSLNPGYKEEANKTAALALKKDEPQIIEGIWREKIRTLELQAEGFLPRQKEYADGMNTIGDNYWYDKLSDLMTDVIGADEKRIYECRGTGASCEPATLVKEKADADAALFFSKIALVQYCAYTSEKYKDFPHGGILPSQKLTKELIRCIVYSHPDTLFVIMRSWKRWRRLLDDDVWFKMQPRLVINTNMSQALTMGNLKENYQSILNVLRTSSSRA
jgi:hypothetical protein